MLDTPVVLIVFKRLDSTRMILERVRTVQPKKLYIISDQGRNDEEIALVKQVRDLIEDMVTWECELVKDYANENRGVYEQIGMGALRVFQTEERAIFLEDDNLPEVSFFSYCEQMLEAYKDENQILWVCGTNYFGITEAQDGSDIHFTQHLLPCGWASWANKFTKYYDKDLRLTEDPDWERKLRAAYRDKRLFVQQSDSVKREIKKKLTGERYHSWDFHMVFSVKMNGLLGIAPTRNQITNIGIDEHSIHGAKAGDEMTERFHNVPSYPMPSVCKIPDEIKIDSVFEKKTGEVILYPLGVRFRMRIKKILRVPDGMRFRDWLRIGKNR